jgi:hypothetical protein
VNARKNGVVKSHNRFLQLTIIAFHLTFDDTLIRRDLRIYDISLTTCAAMPIWPGEPGIEMMLVKEIDIRSLIFRLTMLPSVQMLPNTW